MINILKEGIKTVKQNVPGMKSMGLIDLRNNGASVIISEPANDKKIEDTAVFQSEIYRQAVKSLKLSSQEPSQEKKVTEILIKTKSESYVLVSVTGNFVGSIVVDTQKTNMGICRAVVNKIKMKITETLRDSL